MSPALAGPRGSSSRAALGLAKGTRAKGIRTRPLPSTGAEGGPGKAGKGSGQGAGQGVPVLHVVLICACTCAGTLLIASRPCPRGLPRCEEGPTTRVDVTALEAVETALAAMGAAGTGDPDGGAGMPRNAGVYPRLRALLELGASGAVNVSTGKRLLRTAHAALSNCEQRLQLAQEELGALRREAREQEQARAQAVAAADCSRDAGGKGEMQKLRAQVRKLKTANKRLERDYARAQELAAQKPAPAGAQGYECEATAQEMQQYLSYEPRKACPNDWYFVQRLIFKKKCFALPRRRCRAVTPADPVDPLPLPRALFEQAALDDRSVRWDLHDCKSFQCLLERPGGDCRDCFNLTREEKRWKYSFRGTIPMADVIRLKNHTLRLGLDVGGGTGSFAAHMARYNVTVMTTALNFETFRSYAGLPYMETIALRGLIPLHVPHQARLPLFDGVLDLIHSMNSIKYIPLEQFEELMYEWDRVLRVGGILWFDMFYAQVTIMPKYVAIIELLQYKKLYWNFTPKTDIAEREGVHVYLNCVLEKQAAPGNVVLNGPAKEHTKW